MISFYDVIDLLKETGVRDKYIVMVCEGPVSAEWAKEIAADSHAETAEEAVGLAEELLSGKK